MPQSAGHTLTHGIALANHPRPGRPDQYGNSRATPASRQKCVASQLLRRENPPSINPMKKSLVPFVVAAGVSALPSAACDLCAVYNVNAAEGTRNRGFSISAAEQFTHFGTLQEDGRRVPDPVNQYLNS